MVTKKKLTLAKETLRSLSATALNQVVGGTYYSQYMSCNNYTASAYTPCPGNSSGCTGYSYYCVPNTSVCPPR